MKSQWSLCYFFPVSFSKTCAIIASDMAIKVTRKDQGEANENIIRRFNRKVLQSGVMPLAKSQLRFSKPISKRERRRKAILREIRKAEKTERIKLGLK
jgi:ribosomal protein S21